MFICDMCRKQLGTGMKWIALKDETHHICESCIKTCQDIVNDPKTGVVVYMNEYKDQLAAMKERV